MELTDLRDSDARKHRWLRLSINLYKFQVYGRDQDGNDQVPSYGESGISKSTWNILNKISWNIGLSVIQCEGQSWYFFIRVRFYNWTPLDWHLERRYKACSYGWQMKVSSIHEKFFTWEAFFRKFRTVKILMQREWSTVFTPILLHKFYVLDWVLDGRIRTCSGWGIQV